VKHHISSKQGNIISSERKEISIRKWYNLQNNESTIGQTPLEQDRVPVKLFFAYLLQDHNKE
jgi:hypothetical protein